MAGMLPANLSFFMSRLQGVSTSQFKVEPQTSSSATPNQIVRFNLPSNTLVNMKSIRLLFNAATGAGSSGNTFRLPPNNSSYIERMSVYMGGVLVQNSFQAYNALCHAKQALLGDKGNAALEHPEIVRRKSYVDGSTFEAASAESYTDEDDRLAILSFEGLVGSIEPYIIDTGLLPQITLEFTLASGSVVSNSKGVFLGSTDSTNGFLTAGTGTPTYTLSNLSLQVEVIGMASSVLDQIIEQRISSVGYLSLPFKNYFTSISSHTTASRFNINSASWDRLWLVYRADNFDTAGAPLVVNGYKVEGGALLMGHIKAQVNNASNVDGTTLAIDNFAGGTIQVGDYVYSQEMTQLEGVPRITALASAGNSATNTLTLGTKITVADNKPLQFYREVGVPQYDEGGVFDTNKEKYQSKFFQFKQQASGSLVQAQLQVNNANIPAYNQNTPEALAMTLNSLDTYDVKYKMTLDQFKNNYYINCYRFSLPESDFSRMASGLDTRSVSAQVSVLNTGLNSTQLYAYAETTSELRVAGSRQIEVIV
jgi:hypothetical protein